MPICFQDICNCSCNSTISDFDTILNNETKFDITLEKMCHSNIGWFTDKTLSDVHLLNECQIDRKFGIYFLWHKDDYCDIHDLFHMKCLYVGKGYIFERIMNHFQRKDFSEEMLVYFTYYEMENRLSKYIEQLVLDIFNIPFNSNENTGQNKLCMYFTQLEVD